MSFRAICLLAFLATAPFGLAFLLAPAWIGSFYGVNEGGLPAMVMLGRLYGVELLLAAGFMLAMSDSSDPHVQQRAAAAGCIMSVLGVLVSLQATLTGVVNSLMWSTVAIWGFFVVTWGVFFLRHVSSHRLA